MLENRFTNEKYIAVKSATAFDGIDDYSYFGNVLDLSSDFSVMLSIKPKSLVLEEAGIERCSFLYFGDYTPNDNLSIRLAYRKNSSVFRGFRLNFSYDGTLLNVISLGETTSIPILNVWHHIAFTYDSSTYTINLWLNNRKIDSATMTSPLYVSTLGMFIGKPLSGEFEISNVVCVNRIIEPYEIESAKRYIGILNPNTGMDSTLHSPIGFSNISKRSFFDAISTSNPVSISQASHGFVKGNIIREDSGTWLLADGSIDAFQSNPPTIVSSVIDLNTFEYKQVGVATIESHGFGHAGDLVFCSNLGTPTLSENENIIARVLDTDTLLIPSIKKIGIACTTKQYNVNGNTVNVEIIGELFGKSDADIGIPTPTTQNTFVDLYNGGIFDISGPELKSSYPYIKKGLKLSNIGAPSKSVNIQNTNFPNSTSDFTFFHSFMMNTENVPTLIPTECLIFHIENTVTEYGIKITYDYINKRLYFKCGLNYTFNAFIPFQNMSNVFTSIAIIRRGGLIEFSVNGYTHISTNTPLDLTGSNIYKLGL